MTLKVRHVNRSVDKHSPLRRGYWSKKRKGLLELDWGESSWQKYHSRRAELWQDDVDADHWWDVPTAEDES